MVSISFVFLRLLFVSLIRLWDDVEIGAELKHPFDGIYYQPPPLKTELHALIYHPAQRYEILLVDLGGIGFSRFQTLRRPVDRMRLWQTPFERPVALVHLLHELRVHFVFFPQ